MPEKKINAAKDIDVKASQSKESSAKKKSAINVQAKSTSTAGKSSKQGRKLKLQKGSIPENKTLLYAIKKYLREYHLPEEKFLIDFAHYVRFEDTSDPQSIVHLETELSKVYGNFNDCPGHLEERKMLHYIRTLHFCFAFQYKNFGVPDAFIKPKINTRLVEEQPNKFVRLTDGHIQEQYFDPLAALLANTDTELYVFEYLEDVLYKNPGMLSKYFGGHRTLYAAIESKIVNDKFTYVRFLALPIHHKLANSLRTFNDYSVDQKELLSAVINLTSLPLFQHVFDTIQEYGDAFDENSTGFFLVPHAPRAFQWAYADGGKYIVTELYKYPKTNMCKPENIYIDTLNYFNSDLFISYEDECKSLRQNPSVNPRIYKDDFTSEIVLEILMDLLVKAQRRAETLSRVVKRAHLNNREYVKTRKDIAKQYVTILEEKIAHVINWQKYNR